MWPIETAPLLGIHFFFVLGGEKLGIWEGLYKRVCLQGIAEKNNVYYYIHG